MATILSGELDSLVYDHTQRTGSRRAGLVRRKAYAKSGKIAVFPEKNLPVSLAPTQHLIDELRHGRMIVLADAEDRENEGDLVLAADFVTPEAINFMATHARGLICLTLTEERCRQLNLPLMVSENRSPMGTAFTVSIEAADGRIHRHLGRGSRAHGTGGHARSTPSPRTSCSRATSSR